MNRPPHSPLRELLAGIKAVVPLLIGAAPFGLIYGVLATGTGLPPAAAQGMSLIVFAGAAQFIAVGLLDVGAPAAIVLLTTFVINLRHVLYSASLAPHLRPLRPAWKWGLAFLITDEAHALAISRYRAAAAHPAASRDHSHAHWYVLGAGLVIYVVWQISTAVGIALGDAGAGRVGARTPVDPAEFPLKRLRAVRSWQRGRNRCARRQTCRRRDPRESG